MHIPKVFIFDMDGTMFDTEQISYICWRDVCREYGYELPEDLFRSVIGMDNRRIAAVFGRYFGPDFPYEPIREKKVADQLQYYREHIIPVKPGLRDILAYAKGRGSRCAVASSSPESQIRFLLEKAGVASYFSVVQSGEDVAHGKPAPDIFLEACRRSGAKPEQALVLEDSRNGLLAAHEAHIPSVFIPDIAPVSDDVAALAWKRCRTLADVPDLLEAEEKAVESL